MRLQLLYIVHYTDIPVVLLLNSSRSSQLFITKLAVSYILDIKEAVWMPNNLLQVISVISLTSKKNNSPSIH